jgi:hypothetical protein
MSFNKKSVILFGSGDLGNDAYQTYKYFYNIVCFSDNDPIKRGKGFKSLKVIHPRSITEHEFDLVIISSMFYHPIHDQLIDLGIPERKIKCYSPLLLDLHSLISNFPTNLLKYLYALLFNPFGIISTFINSIAVLLKSKTNFRFNHFTPHDGLNSLFYWSLLYNVKKYGFGGSSPSMGSGDYNLSKAWHFPIVSGYLYKKLAPFLPGISFLVCMFSFFLFTEQNSPIFCSVVITIGIFSFSFYSNSFLAQNYNSMGWAFLPICIFAIGTNNTWLFCAGSCLVAMGSLTANLCLGIMLTVINIKTLTFISFIFYIPAIFISLFNFLKSGAIIDNFKKTIASINAGKNTKYKMLKNFHKDLDMFVFIALQLLFIVAYSMMFKEIPLMLVISLLICIVNNHILRFADIQSLVALTLITSTYYTLISGTLLMLPIYFFIINSPYCLLGYKLNKNNYRLETLKPFDVKPFLDGMSDFLAPTESNSRILFSFENPEGNYQSLFDSQRVHFELPFHIATRKSCNLMPNWYLIAEDMTEDLPKYWGRDIDSIKVNIQNWKPDYLIYYTLDLEEIDPQLEKEGFQLLNTFYWNDFPQLSNISYGLSCLPKWFLFRVPQKLLQS